MTTWRMPIESHEHERLWMAWPTSGYTLGETEVEVLEARETWAAVANAASEFEPVSIVVNPGDERVAAKYLSGAIERVIAPLDDAWMRDIGPSFVLGDDGELGAVNFVFNGWGQQDWASWDNDQHIGKIVAEAAGATLIDSHLVNEGGGIQVDGTGQVVLTRTVQLDPGRNPGGRGGGARSHHRGHELPLVTARAHPRPRDIRHAGALRHPCGVHVARGACDAPPKF